MSPEEIVNEFTAAAGRKDVDALVKLLADDIEYDNVPMPTINGVEAVREFLGPFIAGADEVEFVIKRQVASGNTVMNERVDRFRTGDKTIEIEVAGIFEVRDGKITLWRDYFDLPTFMNQMG